jgi:hypothetical protein
MLRPLEGASDIDCIGMSKGATANMPASTGTSFVIVEKIGVVKCYIGNLSWDLCGIG